MSDSVVISNASCLIALFQIDEVDILRRLFNEVIVTKEVALEVNEELPDWISIQENIEKKQLKVLSLELDIGEASSIAFALDQQNPLLIIDERKGRKVAKRLGLRVIGTLGLILIAKERKIIPNGRTILNKLEAHGFWLSEKLKRDFLAKLGES